VLSWRCCAFHQSLQEHCQLLLLLLLLVVVLLLFRCHHACHTCIHIHASARVAKCPCRQQLRKHVLILLIVTLCSCTHP
jgi:hypothetical protein